MLDSGGYMRNLSELLQLNYNPLLLILMSILAFSLTSLLNMILQIVFAPVFKLKPIEIKVLGFKYEKQKEGKWIYVDHKFGLGFSAAFNLDLKKYKELDSKKIQSAEKVFFIVISIIEFIIAVGVFFACGFAGSVIAIDVLAMMVISFGVAFLVFILSRIVVTFVVLIKMNSKNTLGGYYQSALSMVRTGVPYENMDLKSVPELNFKKVSDTERLMYFPLYFEYLDSTGQKEKMAAAVGEIESTLKPGVDSRIHLFTYCTLVYYYSYIYLDTDKAKEYYSRTGGSLEKDDEANGLRVKAFYELNCFGNVEKAREYCRAAEAAVDTFSVGSEREYERLCIARLKEAVNNFQG